MHYHAMMPICFSHRCIRPAETSAQPVRLDSRVLDRLVDKFFAKGLAESTQRAYRCGQTKFLQFCEAGGFRAIPVTEATLCKFVAHVVESDLKHRTIKVYLSAVRKGPVRSKLPPASLYTAGGQEGRS